MELLPGLGYVFRRPELLEAALTHRSVGAGNNERLEFLGDSVLGFVIAEALFEALPKAREGVLSRARATLVRKETLASLARTLNLGPALRLGGGELKSGGRERDSILADAMEAIIGAIFLDGGIEAVRNFVLALYAEPLERMDASRIDKDAKTRLQEWLQGRGHPLPAYNLRKSLGEAHARRFVVGCQVALLETEVLGEGSSLQRAEQAAAEDALTQLAGKQEKP